MKSNYPSKCAAQYLRMSTDQQDLSIGIQKTAIAAYAARSELTLVATYEDEARSGLRIANRPGMRRLMSEVMGAECPFQTILVYDVSRWGRFQNTDASAYYEYHCHLHGVEVIYVAEAFSADLGPFSALMKNMKRAMAAEYSRELAVKVRAGIERVVSQGYSAGGQPAIGLVRQAVSRDGIPRLVLKPGERKGIQSDRVQLVHGPQHEVALVHRLFDLYANTAANVNDLVRLLEAEGLRTAKGGKFTRRVVDALLRFEPFAGDYVWGKLTQTPRGVRKAPADRQLRVDNVVQAIIDRETWDRVQAKLSVRSLFRRGEPRLLRELAQALKRDPDLTGAELSSHGCAPAQTYLKTFGSMEAAYALAGRTSNRAEIASRARVTRTKELTRSFQQEIATLLATSGFKVAVNLQSFVLTLDFQVRLQVYLSWRRSFTREPAWFVQRRRLARSDWRLIVRLDDQSTPLDYFLVPEHQRASFPMLLREEHLPSLAMLRLPALDELPHRLQPTIKSSKPNT